RAARRKQGDEDANYFPVQKSWLGSNASLHSSGSPLREAPVSAGTSSDLMAVQAAAIATAVRLRTIRNSRRRGLTAMRLAYLGPPAAARVLPDLAQQVHRLLPGLVPSRRGRSAPKPCHGGAAAPPDRGDPSGQPIVDRREGAALPHRGVRSLAGP